MTSKTNSIAILDPAVALASDDGWDEQEKQWTVILRTGVLPEHVKSAGVAIALAMRGRDFGWSPIESCMKMCIIKGKVTMYAETLAGMMLQHANANDEVFEPVERGRERAAIKVQRKSMREPFVFEYTVEDARDAGLLGQPNYKKHIRAMLWARVVSIVSRSVYSDVTAGAYVSSEMDFPATVVQVDQLDDDTPLGKVLGVGALPVVEDKTEFDDERGRLMNTLAELAADVAEDFTDGDGRRAKQMIIKRVGIPIDTPPTIVQLKSLIAAASTLLADSPKA